MKKVSLKFEDILHLLEFVEYTKKHECGIDMGNNIITCQLSDAEIELALNGYKALLIEG